MRKDPSADRVPICVDPLPYETYGRADILHKTADLIEEMADNDMIQNLMADSI